MKEGRIIHDIMVPRHNVAGITESHYLGKQGRG